ncbi:hypothetical protein [Legionella parisiensis]|uniref:Uncharacterized protein n=1 Tax=Legionella parisiensis TaxID=45071 RepID=A0A1E5JTW2_9GAMM|nr:hypothetical protein [Legionella parisiensis]KTD40424.1 hypothetical protein Lpar_1741 [Legionella parisiensis]OEH47833.1 hypothetical protein lpari_01211 [Legionella parisiensis]STX77142.1 Uncharacterised protein [Legionella parisiensis]
MPVSKECIKLLQNLVVNYGEEGGSDVDYASIYPLLKEFLVLVIHNQKNHKDERIIGFLSTSALLLEENPCFVEACRLFAISYQQKTHALDSMLDEEFNIQSELDESWGKQLESEVSQSLEPSRFFVQLQEAITKRAQRIAEKKKEILENPTP